MENQGMIQSAIDGFVEVAGEVLLPAICIVFVVGLVLRSLIYFTLKREHWFAQEFDKRVQNFFLEDDKERSLSFYMTCKKLLERTFYELFEMRTILKRRKTDFVMTISDRLFLISHGVAWTIRDVLKHIRHIDKRTADPKLLQVSKHSLQNNPCFSKVFGVLPSHGINDILNILPGIFIVCGIFGTFLGIMKALPTLASMDIANVEGTKVIMNQFLIKVSFAMSTSIVGIVLSVAMNVVNTVMSPERLFVSTVDRFENSMSLLWDRCDTNDVPKNVLEFDESRDAIEALAEQSLDREMATVTVLRKLNFSNERRLRRAG